MALAHKVKLHVSAWKVGNTQRFLARGVVVGSAGRGIPEPPVSNGLGPTGPRPVNSTRKPKPPPIWRSFPLRQNYLQNCGRVSKYDCGGKSRIVHVDVFHLHKCRGVFYEPQFTSTFVEVKLAASFFTSTNGWRSFVWSNRAAPHHLNRKVTESFELKVMTVRRGKILFPHIQHAQND